MQRRLYILVALLACETGRTGRATPLPLADVDLVIEGVAVDSDSAQVLQHLESPSRRDSTGWSYGDLSVSFREGKVDILSVTGPTYATARGLKVGDSVDRVRTLYRSCYDDDQIYQVCWPTEDFDERAVTVSLRDGRVRQINVGRILEP